MLEGVWEDFQILLQLLHRIFVEKTEREVNWLGDVVAVHFSGRIRWDGRPTAHKVPCAFVLEDVKMHYGTDTLSIDDLNSAQSTHNPVLSGRAEVTLKVLLSPEDEAVDKAFWHEQFGEFISRRERRKRIVLLGNMVDNRLHGVVLAWEPIPGVSFPDNDFRFYIEGYDSDGAPIVRLLTPEEKEANPFPSTGKEKLHDAMLYEELIFEQLEREADARRTWYSCVLVLSCLLYFVCCKERQ